MDINELISAAQEGIEKSDLQFDPALQRYFDPESNLYYSPETRDYFDKRNGAYYKRVDGELIRTGQDERFKPARPEEDSEDDEENEQGIGIYFYIYHFFETRCFLWTLLRLKCNLKRRNRQKRGKR